MSSLVGCDNPTSPNAIPARSSSTGVIHHGSLHQASKSVLRPLPEESWISPKARQTHDQAQAQAETQIQAPAHALAQAPTHAQAPASSSPRPLSNPQLTPLTPPQPPQPQLLRRSSSIGKTHTKHMSGDESSLAYRAHTGKQKQSATTATSTTTATTAGGGTGGDGSGSGSGSGVWTAEKDKIILGPYDYLEGHPGKDIRTALIRAFDAFFKVPAASLAVITRVIGMLHTASLLIDDVQDNSTLRRGVPVAHNIFGTAQTINSANYVYFVALQEVQKLARRDEAIEIFTSELLNLHRGQGMDLYWRDTLTCPSEDDYLEMVQNKTGGLFRLAVRLMQAESAEQRGRLDAVPLVNLMGLVFQICDDHLNLCSSAYTRNKGVCEDLTEGKFSFPIIHAVRADPANLQLLNILRLRTTDDQVKLYAVRYMHSVGSFDHSRRVIADLKARAARLIADMDAGTGKGDQLRSILDRMDVE